MSELSAVTPPEGQSSFSGIPEADFVEDVDAHMAGEDNCEDKLKVGWDHLIRYYRHSNLFFLPKSLSCKSWSF